MASKDAKDDVDQEEMVHSLKRQRGTAKGRLTMKVKLFDDLITRSPPVESEVLEDVFKEICELFDNIEKKNSELLELIDEDSQDEHLCYINAIQRTKCDIQSKLIVFRNKTRKDTSSDDGCNILIKKVDPPIFKGDVREFPTFVKDYTRLMISRHGKDPFILRMSLQGKAKEAIGRLDDFDQMWNRLHERFGSSAKIVDAVIGEICSLKPVPEGNKSRLLSLISIVEQAWLDLRKIGKLNEITNSSSLVKVERLLPADLKREWTHKAIGLDDDEKFEKLVEFLTNERQAIEYMEDETRLTKADTKASVHLASTESETEASTLVQAISKLTQSQETSQKQMLNCFNNMTQSVMDMLSQNQNRSNTLNYNPGYNSYTRGCWFHNNNLHDINQCTAFQKLSADEKMNHMRAFGACFLCLEPGHTSRYCSKTNCCDVKINAHDVCGKWHHPYLHSVFLKIQRLLRHLQVF